MVNIIDLNFLGIDHSIAVFLIKDNEGYTLVESGPYSTHHVVIAALDKMGIAAERIHTLLLTHIHFDHAGAAWWWARQGTHVYVHPRGLKHMIDPTRLYNSAKQIYGDRMEELWGKMESIDSSRITAVEDRQVLSIGGNEWTAHYTPGHASHHIAWQLGSELFTGDVGGCSINGGPVVPPCPPPDINREQWMDSIERMRQIGASAFYLTHFGKVTDTVGHLDDLSKRLDKYFDWIRPYYQEGTDAETIEPLFKQYVTEELTAAGVSARDLASYMAANPPFMSVVGMLRALKVSASGHP